MSVKLERQQVAQGLQGLEQWTLRGDKIERELQFEDFVDAMIFVNHVAEIAEEESHHPEIGIIYNRVSLALTTHDAGGLTAKDLAMARRIDGLLE